VKTSRPARAQVLLIILTNGLEKTQIASREVCEIDSSVNGA
jgi:hypothetical protein